MSALQDLEMERLSDLFAQGQLSNAQEIASLLKVELGEPNGPVLMNDYSRSYFELLGQMTNQR
jgi:hypothetical protein